LLYKLLMIQPRFRYVSKFEIIIFDEDTGQEIGKIKTPSATITEKESAIQVCGFDYACQLYGCGIYGNLDKTGNYHSKKDIQLLWTKTSVPLPFEAPKFKQKRDNGIHNCSKCYSDPCKCKELRIYKSGESLLDKL